MSKEQAATWTKIEELTPWADNPRQNAEAVAEVAKSIRRFGFASPIVANSRDNTVIAGHSRLEAAKRLELDQVPVRWMDLDPVDAKVLALADNRLGEIAKWDETALAQILQDIAAVDDTALSDTGFTDQQIAALTGDDISKEFEAQDGGELDLDSFDTFDHTCPRCGFEWDK